MSDATLMDYTPNPEQAIVRSMLLTRNLWPNLPYKRKNLEKRIDELWNRRHFGCFEKAVATILATKLSRSCTHQLVRHRLFSYNQLSMRQVEPKKLNTICPPSIESNIDARQLYRSVFEGCRKAYQELREFGIPKEDARFIIPMGIETQIEITGNFRVWLHFLSMRTNPTAQWEIRELAWKCHELLKSIASNVFADRYKKSWIYV
ncbi:Flavin-dependent thymidylate synthase [subsurface metagenome]